MAARCTIRPYVDGDWRILHAAVKESMADLMPWLPWCHPGYSEDDSRQWIVASREGHATFTLFDFAVFDESGRFVGACGVNQVNLEYRCANLGYWIRSSARGRGLAAAAAREVCDWTFRNTHLNRLEVMVAVDNAASQRVAQKMKASYEGCLRSRLIVSNRPTDAFVYSIVRGDARPRVQDVEPAGP